MALALGSGTLCQQHHARPGEHPAAQQPPDKPSSWSQPYTYFLMLPTGWRSLHPLREKRTECHGPVSRCLPTQLNVFPFLIEAPNTCGVHAWQRREHRLSQVLIQAPSARAGPETCPARAADQKGRPPRKAGHCSTLGIPLREGRPLHARVRGF